MDKTALITGGSGAVGGALVRRFLEDGYRVAFTFLHNTAAADALVCKTEAAAFHTDLTKRDQVEAMAHGVIERFGRIDILVNNAGRTQVMPFALIEEEDWDEVIASNLKSMYLVTHAVARDMIARKSGVIINIGSLAGHRMLDVPAHYAAAKAGVTGFTLALAKELSRYNIRVNEVVPGLLSDGVGLMAPEKETADYVKHCAAGRAGDPKEIAEVVAFLASEKASYINAQSIHVDGGI
ncbi:MAG: SDR family oxidoreductase [Candidatus Sumerlaeota bacterium]|nr:SDR family oxidoreductase [Candidatus Sumerlaeota bacterium]